MVLKQQNNAIIEIHGGEITSIFKQLIQINTNNLCIKIRIYKQFQETIKNYWHIFGIQYYLH